MKVRINKFLADCGVSSRRNSEELILQGRVAVNNKIVNSLSFKVDEDTDSVTFDGEKVKPKKNIYLLLNKPKSIITSTSDDKSRKTVTDLIKTNERIFPVGRLDYNTTGVLLLTNDGNFSQLLTHPSNKVPREYEVKLERELPIEDEQKLLKGVWIEPRKGKFEKVTYLNKKSRKTVNVLCTEGRNHFVKKMFGALNYTVKGLHRVSFANIYADVPVGSYRKLNPDEVQLIISTYRIDARFTKK